jgi:hypothetical protein
MPITPDSLTDVASTPINWGSVSDWIYTVSAIILGIFSINYLKKTLENQSEFNSQQITSNQQQLELSAKQAQLIDIETRRATREVHPRVSLEFVGLSTEERNSQNGTKTAFETRAYLLHVGRNEANDLCFEYFDLPQRGNYSRHFKPGEKIASIINPEEESIRLLVQFPKEDEYSLVYPIKLRLHYKDEDGRAYHKDYSMSREAVTLEQFGVIPLHPNVNTCNFFSKEYFTPVAPGEFKPLKLPWLPAKERVPTKEELERFPIQHIPDNTKKRLLCMFSLNTSYLQEYHLVEASPGLAALIRMQLWPLEPFK